MSQSNSLFLFTNTLFYEIFSLLIFIGNSPIMLRSFRTGEHGALAEVLTLRGKEFEISTRRPRPVNADGEIVTHTPTIFRVLPKAIDVVVPHNEV